MSIFLSYELDATISELVFVLIDPPEVEELKFADEMLPQTF